MLRANCAAEPWRTAHDRRWFPVQRALTRRARCPIDGVLEHSWHAVVVLRRRDQHGIRLADGGFTRRHGLRLAFGHEVIVVGRLRLPAIPITRILILPPKICSHRSTTLKEPIRR